MEELCTSKTFLKMAERMHTPHFTPLDPPLTISCRSHQKSLAYFSHLAPLVLLFFTKRQSQKSGAMAQCPPPLNTFLLPSLLLNLALLTLMRDACVEVISDEKVHSNSLLSR